MGSLEQESSAVNLQQDYNPAARTPTNLAAAVSFYVKQGRGLSG